MKALHVKHEFVSITDLDLVTHHQLINIHWWTCFYIKRNETNSQHLLNFSLCQTRKNHGFVTTNVVSLPEPIACLCKQLSSHKLHSAFSTRRLNRDKLRTTAHLPQPHQQTTKCAHINWNRIEIFKIQPWNT